MCMSCMIKDTFELVYSCLISILTMVLVLTGVMFNIIVLIMILNHQQSN